MSSKVRSSMIFLNDHYVSKFLNEECFFPMIYIISTDIFISVDILFIHSKISWFISCALLLFNTRGPHQRLLPGTCYTPPTKATSHSTVNRQKDNAGFIHMEIEAQPLVPAAGNKDSDR